MPWTIVFKPIIPIPVLIGVGVVMLAGMVASYAWGARGTGKRRRGLLVALRATALGIILMILARPMALQPQESVPDRPPFAILIDTSQSMNTEDVGDISRFRAAVKSLLDRKAGPLIDRLAQQYQVKLYGFDRKVRRVSDRELARQERVQGEETRIAAALMNITQDGRQRPQGILLLSDGRSNEVNSRAALFNAARYLRAQQVPVWTVPLGSATEAKDVYTVARLSSNYMLAGQPASIQVAVTGSGYTNWNVKLNLYRENDYVTSTQVTLRNGHADVSFPIQEERKGLFQYRVAVDPLPGETDKENNERTVIVRVIDEKVKVLVVEATPHWDSKFLLRALRADMNIETTSIFHINARKTFAVVEKISEDNALSKTLRPGVRMPKTKAELNQYDCIFLGKNVDDVFSTQDLRLLRDYVAERGGSVVFFRGKPYAQHSSELARLEPVSWGQGSLPDTRFELTASGVANPIFDYASHDRDGDIIVQELPSMISITRVDRHKSLAVILAQTKDHTYGNMATLAYHRYGKGKVMTIAASGLWQWGFLPEALDEYDDIHARFWGQMIRWLVSDSDFLPGQDISFAVDKNTYSPDETVRLAISTRLTDASHQPFQIEVTDPVGQKTNLTPKRQTGSDSLYSAYFRPEKQGEYRATLRSQQDKLITEEVRFTVYDDSLEARSVQADRDILLQLAETTGAEALTLAEVSTLPERVETFAQLTREHMQPEDIWDRGSVFTLVICLLGCEWLLRRVSGLV